MLESSPTKLAQRGRAKFGWTLKDGLHLATNIVPQTHALNVVETGDENPESFILNLVPEALKPMISTNWFQVWRSPRFGYSFNVGKRLVHRLPASGNYNSVGLI